MSQHQARKRFGQNFLTDESVVESIVRAVAPARDDVVVEIGPGLSALTRPLLERLDHLTAVEIDRDLAARLRKQFDESRLTVVEADAVVKGQTASASYKPAILDNGVRVMVPPHIVTGTRIVVDVYEREYVKRAE